MVTSRPEARAGRWLNPEERLYLLGLSYTNIGRCLKSYAVVTQMTSEEYDEFHEVIESSNFSFRSQLSKFYLS